MAKTFKRIAALATAIALVVCFAVSASAINVVTTTQYAGENVNVTVNVTEGGSAAYVTYYAKNPAGNVVYVDQEALVGGSATIKYQTAESSLKGEVKVGYTGANSAETKDIAANTITYPGGTKYLPTEEKTATITFSYTPTTEGKKVGTVTADANATVGEWTYDSSTGTVRVPLSEIKGDVTLSLTETDSVIDTAVATFIDAALMIVKDGALGEAEGVNTAKAGDRKMTVIGKAQNATNYGIIVSESAIATGERDNLEGFDVYEAFGQRTDGLFAVQVIDEGEDATAENAIFNNSKSYYVAVYVKTASGKYKVDAAADPYKAN